MATKVKEPNPPKERNGTSPPQKKSPGMLKQASPSQRNGSSTTTTRRNVPNYLKPTMSSRLDPSSKQQQVKKISSSGDNNVNNKPISSTVARRRSLDKPLPPAASHVQQKTSPNPKERNIRSSSFTTSRTSKTTPQKPISDRLSKVSKDHPMHPRPGLVKKTSMSNKKQETMTEARDVLVADIPPIEPQEEDLGSSMTEADEQLLITAFPDELAPVENKTESELKGEEVDKPSVTTGHGDDEAADDDKVEEELEDKLQDKEITWKDDFQLEEHGEVVEHDNSHHPEEKVEQGPIIIEVEKTGSEEELKGERLHDEEVAIVETKFIMESPEIESQDDVAAAKDADHIKPPAAATKPEVVQGKRDSAPVSNDVIEETASKLREQRKNKVRALAGAFETVISLQEAK